MKTRRRKILQPAKRTLLNLYFYAYEYKIINEYEQHYQQVLNEFEVKFAHCPIVSNWLTLFHAVQTYLNDRTHHIIHETNHKIKHFRKIIARRRQRSSLAKKTIGVSPQLTIDVLHHPFHADELVHLSLGESYIRPNQSALRPYKHRKSQVKNELTTIKGKVKRQLTNYCKREPPKAMMDRYSDLLDTRLCLRFMALLSFVNQMRAERDRAKSIRRKLRKAKLILRVCDKGGGLHLSTKSDHERKAAEYRPETQAYVELSDNPLEELITNVTKTLKELKDKKTTSIVSLQSFGTQSRHCQTILHVLQSQSMNNISSAIKI
ncbi:unnamed protein product [Didymodactylos carnosus]|uniref:Uncharacterized protein n=1 Tax=Didymodactylos carnosus TaxID=1234261 RepID=A0A8S2E8Q9_9BILA|nr:unnamed protein product [Didymodactylos carnosus]CAF3856401.1 unnamed protein product [Didymodactylos carnosus]